MARYTPSGSVGTVSAINSELEKVSVAVQDSLSRKGDSPNQMEAPLDMNSEQILNLPKAESPLSPVRKQELDLALASFVNISTDVFSRVGTDVQYNIPSDFPTIQACLDATYNKVLGAPEANIIINIETGHRLTAGVKLTSGDYSRYRIISDDAVVYLDPAFVPVNSDIVAESNRAVFFYDNAKSPVLDCLIDVEDDYTVDGVVGHAGAEVYVDRDAGVLGARMNLLIRAAQCYAKYTLWNRAGRNCARFTENSTFVISNSELSQSWLDNTAGGSASDAALHISRSSIGQAQDCVINNSGFSAITVRRSWAYLFGTAIDTVGVLGQSSVNICIRPFDGAHIIANGVTFNGNSLTPFACNIGTFNTVNQVGTVFSTNAPDSIPDYDNTDSTERGINIYDTVRVKQIHLPAFSLNNPDVTVNFTGFSDSDFMSATLNVTEGTGWMAGSGFTGRLDAFNSLVVGCTNTEARIRMADAAKAVAETLDMTLTVIGTPS